jgi:hypothetical protein
MEMQCDQINFNQKIANIATRECHIEELSILLDEGIYSTQDAINDAAESNHLKIIRLLAEHNRYPTSNGLDRTVSHGNIEMSELIARYGIQPTGLGANLAAEGGEIEALNWLAINYNIYPDQIGAGNAFYEAAFDQITWGTVVWLINHSIYPDQEDINRTVASQNKEFFDFLEMYNIVPMCT